MKHIEKLPEAKGRPATSPRQRKPLSFFKIALSAAILIGGVGYGMTKWHPPVATDHLSEREKAEIIADFTRIHTVQVERVNASDVDAVLDTMRLAPDAKQGLKNSVKNPVPQAGQTVLAKLALWDFAAEDGDVVRVSSAGYEADFVLTNQPITIAIPVDRSNSIQIIGVRDGGGGITIGISNGDGKISLPVISEGQTLALPVGF